EVRICCIFWSFGTERYDFCVRCGVSRSSGVPICSLSIFIAKAQRDSVPFFAYLHAVQSPVFGLPSPISRLPSPVSDLPPPVSCLPPSVFDLPHYIRKFVH